MKRLVIPGAAGFVGTNFLNNLSDGFINRFDEIVLIDILQYNQSWNRISILNRDNVVIVDGSIFDSEIMRSNICDGDLVLHLAVEENTFNNPQNKKTAGVLDYLNYLSEKNLTRFIFLSTSDVYGRNNSPNLTEKYLPIPTILYAANKIAIEAYLNVLYAQMNFPFHIFRPVTIYGPYQHPGWLIPRVITNVLKNNSIQITGDGSVKRDWIYVTDVCNLLERAILDNSISSGQVFNIGTGTEHTVLEVVHMILSRLGKPESLIDFVPERSGDIERQITRAEKAKATFDWSPEVDFESGLSKTILWYKEQLKRK